MLNTVHLMNIMFQLVLYAVLLYEIVCMKPCVPESGSTALIIGQDYVNMENYSIAFHSHPFGIMSYTALNSSNSVLGTYYTSMPFYR
jgi:hypothetical protein